MHKKIISALCAAIMPAMLSSCKTADMTTVPDVTGEFKVTALKVGKADAIILETQNHTVIIDCGERGDGSKISEYLAERGTEKVDYLFITHFDKDHVGGAPEVMENVEIERIVTPDYEGSNDEYEKYLEAVNQHRCTPVRLTKELSFTLDDTLFTVYPPLEKTYKEGDNDFSLAISVNHGSNSFLFAGDAEEVRLSEILSQTDTEYDFLKIPHHGRYEKNTKEFLESVSPKYAVITCSNKNPPDDKVLEILEDLHCNTYLTINGNIEAVSDGKEIKIKQ